MSWLGLAYILYEKTTGKLAEAESCCWWLQERCAGGVDAGDVSESLRRPLVVFTKWRSKLNCNSPDDGDVAFIAFEVSLSLRKS